MVVLSFSGSQGDCARRSSAALPATYTPSQLCSQIASVRGVCNMEWDVLRCEARSTDDTPALAMGAGCMVTGGVKLPRGNLNPPLAYGTKGSGPIYGYPELGTMV